MYGFRFSLDSDVVVVLRMRCIPIKYFQWMLFYIHLSPAPPVLLLKRDTNSKSALLSISIDLNTENQLTK